MTADAAAPRAAPVPRRRPSLLIGAIILAALNLRTAVTSVGPLLDELQRSIGLSHAQAGFLTTMPVLAFAGLGWITPRLAQRVGLERLQALALGLMTFGLVMRANASSGAAFLAWTVPTLAAGAMGNVLLPAVVKRDFPGHVGSMTATYTTALAIGTTAAAAATVPLASAGGGIDWRLGLGAWAAPAAFAAAVWSLIPRTKTPPGASVRPIPVEGLLSSRTAWALAIFFGAQAMQAYIAFGWFAQFYRERAGESAARAGLLVAILSALAIPVSLLVPRVAGRMSSQRPLIAGGVACYAAGYAGMLVAPRAGSYFWVVLVGLGGGMFPLSLTMVGLRSRAPEATAALSAFSQSIGYIIAGIGPLTVGLLRGSTGGWGTSFVLLFVDLAVMAAAGWVAGSPSFVDDDMGSAAPSAA